MKRIFVSLALALASTSVAGTAHASTVTVGNTVVPSLTCAGDTVYIPTSVGGGENSYTVPTGTWFVTSWSAYGPGGGRMDAALVVARPNGANSWTAVYASPRETLASGTVNTFSVPNVPVHAGDVVGAWYGGAFVKCAASAGGNTDEFAPGYTSPPSAGDTLSTISECCAEFDISATLSSAKGSGSGGKAAPIPQVDHVFLCYSKFQNDPGVWESGLAAALLKVGYWLPDAVPGNVAGGTNLGGFHLTCNLDATQKLTGGYVDGSGGVWSSDYASLPGLYPAAG